MSFDEDVSGSSDAKAELGIDASALKLLVVTAFEEEDERVEIPPEKEELCLMDTCNGISELRSLAYGVSWEDEDAGGVIDENGELAEVDDAGDVGDGDTRYRFSLLKSCPKAYALLKLVMTTV